MEILEEDMRALSGRLRKAALLVAVVALCGCSTYENRKAGANEARPVLSAELKLPSIFADHMVLQRDIKVPVWGTGPAGVKVTVSFRGQTRKARVDRNGQWKVNLAPMPASAEPSVMTIVSEPAAVNGPVKISNVLVGEVWICSGQSNMEWVLSNTKDAEKEIASAKLPQIRCFKVSHVGAFEEKDDCPGQWTVCSPETAGNFTAVGYYFGKRIHKTQNVPVGLISSNWGGTPAESWASLPVLQKHADWEFFKRRIDQTRAQLEAPQQKADHKAQERWNRAVIGKKLAVASLGEEKPFALEMFNASKWKKMNLPTHWEKGGLDGVDGIVWFRKEVTVPAGWAGKGLTVDLGPIDDYDNTYWNGTNIGNIGIGTANHWMTARRYIVPGHLVKSGRNVIAVRAIDTGGPGGIYGKPEQMKLSRKDSGAVVSLAGAWRYKLHVRKPAARRGPNLGWVPGGLYNGMIHPLIPYGIRGAIWYQGESNAGRAYQYRTLFPDMIKSWRSAWGQGNFPFYFVQLANFRAKQTRPAEDAWAELQEAQTMTLSLPNTGMAVINDIGQAKDIHPRNKLDVGDRLALIARNQIYGEKGLVYSGPMYRSMKKRGNKIILYFTETGSGLTIAEVRGEGDYTVKKPGEVEPTGFTIAGKDKKFVWAKARIIGKDAIEVWNDDVSEPVAVRYAWHANPICNLYNIEGLPASLFRTDDWPGITRNAR